MKQARLRRFAIATSAAALAALFSVGWSEQRGISLSVETAQARARLYVYPYYYNPYTTNPSDWYAVRAFYAGGPWCKVGTGAGYGTGVGYGAGVGPWAGSHTCYSGWDDYAHHNGISCTPGNIVKGGDGINYVCQ